MTCAEVSNFDYCGPHKAAASFAKLFVNEFIYFEGLDQLMMKGM